MKCQWTQEYVHSALPPTVVVQNLPNQAKIFGLVMTTTCLVLISLARHMEEISVAEVITPLGSCPHDIPSKDATDELQNMIQYAVSGLNTYGSYWVFTWRSDVEHGRYYGITAELVGHSSIVCGIWISDRLVRYLPTYSGTPYYPPAIVSALPVLVLLLIAVDGRISSKIRIIVDRLMERGESHAPPAIVSSQPIARAGRAQDSSLLPADASLTAIPQVDEPEAPVQMPSYDSEPMAANDFAGGHTSWLP